MVKKLVYLVSYCILAVTILCVFFILKPFSYVDHSKSTIVCSKNQTSHAIGPSFFFLFNDEFDQSTDMDIRKLCEFSIIGDYLNSISPPKSKNYTISHKYGQESNWQEVILFSSVLFAVLSLIIEKICGFDKIRVKKKIHLICFSLCIGSLIFFTLVSTGIKRIHCTHKAAFLLSDFKASAYGYGLSAIQAKDMHIQTVLDSYLSSCLKK